MGEDGMMAWADERGCGRIWQENEAQRECLVATAADVVCVFTQRCTPQSTKRDMRLWPWAEALNSKNNDDDGAKKALPSSPAHTHARTATNTSFHTLNLM